MSAVYAWLLLFLVDPAVADLLPADTFELVDPSDPMDSSLFVDALFQDIPDGVVTDLCLVESGGCGKAIGVHPRDGNVGRRVLRRARERGYLPAWCPFYWDIEPGEVSTRGSHGQIYAYSARYLGPCLPLDALDVPLLSALRVGLRAREVCRRKYNRQSKEIRRGHRALRDPCTSEDIRIAWAGRARDPDKVVAFWHNRLAFWKPRARWRTDWRGRCRTGWKMCSPGLVHRPTMKQFRQRAAGETMRW